MITSNDIAEAKRRCIGKWQRGLAALYRNKQDFEDWWDGEGMHKCAFCKLFSEGDCVECPVAGESDNEMVGCEANEWGKIYHIFDDDLYYTVREMHGHINGMIRRIQAVNPGDYRNGE